MARLDRSFRTAPPPKPGIVHFGLGAFHRAHQAVYTADAMAHAGGDWGIIAVAPRSTAVMNALAAQDHLFSVLTLDGGPPRARMVESLVGVLHGAGDPDAVIRAVADPGVQVVTLTVTEKAYAPGSAVLDLLTAGLRARDGAPVTVLSCDNLPGNGGVLRRALPDLPGVTFPSCMVDRIVPATTPSTVELARAALGAEDHAVVAAEPFSQWVIEDDFAAGRPDWAAAGVRLTTDVTPWEQLKLRALNGVHSALAYLGALAGRATIAEALRLEGLPDLLRRYVATEVAASMTPPEGVSLGDYLETVLRRFDNPALGHRTAQVAMDGTQKLPQRLLPVLNTVPSPQLATLIAAAWAEYAAVAHPLDDPLAERVRADLSTEALFGPDGVLPVPDPQRRKLIDGWRQALSRHGAAEVVRS